MKKWIVRVLIVLVLLLVGIQFVPYGRSHENPPVTKEPAWDSPRTRELARTVCFSCHSNETVWPWYASVAPFSWLVQSDVDEGRRHLNFSEWDKPQRHAEDAVEEYEQGDMPPLPYLAIHSEARLSDEKKQELLQGLRATLGEAAEHGEPAPESD